MRRSPKKRRGRKDEGGFALVTTFLLFGLVLGAGITLLDTVVSSRRSAAYVRGQTEAVLLAEAGVHKAVFCLKAASGANCGGAYGAGYTGEANVGFGAGRFSVAVAGTGTSRTITATGVSASGVVMTVRTSASVDAPAVAQPGFDHAVQASDLGVELENNASISGGAVYSDSDIVCSNNADIAFDVFVSRPGGKIDNCDGIIDAHADRVLGSQVTGDAYYKNDPADIAGTSVAGNKYPGSPTPAAKTLPAVDLPFWREATEAGGVIIGGYALANNQTASLGPAKIVGDLILNNNVTLTLDGPVWVTGTVRIGNNSVVRLNPGFGAASGLLLADDPDDPANGGVIDIANNVDILGSGTDGSYILFVSTNTGTTDAAPAIRVQNNAAGGIFYATDGSVRIHNNGSAVAAAGRRVYLDNNAVIDYDGAGATPSSMTLATVYGGIWRLVKDTWRQLK